MKKSACVSWCSWVAVIAFGVGCVTNPDWQFAVLSALLSAHVVAVIWYLSEDNRPIYKPDDPASSDQGLSPPDQYADINDADWWKKDGGKPPWERDD